MKNEKNDIGSVDAEQGAFGCLILLCLFSLMMMTPIFLIYLIIKIYGYF